MAKMVRSYRISEETDTLIKAEAERLAGATGKKVSEADVVEIAVVAWLSGGGSNTPEPDRNTPDRRSVAEAAMREAESKPQVEVSPARKRAESVAERRARETKEHAAKLAEADITARMTGRDDIVYDLENVPHQSPLHVALQKAPVESHHYEVQKRKVKLLTRPHGSTEAKRRREQ